MNKPQHAWMIRAGNDNELADAVQQMNVVAIGWQALGNVSNLQTREDFKHHYQEVYAEESGSRVAVNAGQVFRFVREIEIGHYALTYIKASREILIGEVVGPYQYDEALINSDYPQIRKVNWLERVSRDDFSAPSRNTLGSTLTVFNLDNILDEIYGLVTNTREIEVEEESVEPPFYPETKVKADELIADVITHLAPYDFQNLVAGVLRAMGYKAVSSPPGPDKGIDIIAYPDDFGFEEPRIKVQVKHRKDSAGGRDVRELIGTLQDDKGLFVSTGGFTADAISAAQNARHLVKLLDRDDFISLLLEYYDALEPEFKTAIRLRKVWIPVEPE